MCTTTPLQVTHRAPTFGRQDGSVALDATGDQLTALNWALELLQAAIKVAEPPRILLCTGHLAEDGGWRLRVEGLRVRKA